MTSQLNRCRDLALHMLYGHPCGAPARLFNRIIYGMKNKKRDLVWIALFVVYFVHIGLHNHYDGALTFSRDIIIFQNFTHIYSQNRYICATVIKSIFSSENISQSSMAVHSLV